MDETATIEATEIEAAATPETPAETEGSDPAEPTEAPPVKAAAYDPDKLARLAEAQAALDRARDEFTAKNDAAKAAKARFESRREELEDAVRSLLKPDPQARLPFSDPAPAEPDAKPAADESWRDEPLSALDLPAKTVESIEKAEVRTIGQLADWTNSGKLLTDLPGVGEAKAQKIHDALDAFWAKWGDDRAEPDGEAA
jgi:hypothetical protein